MLHTGGNAPFFIVISEAIAVELGAGLQQQRLNGSWKLYPPGGYT